MNLTEMEITANPTLARLFDSENDTLLLNTATETTTRVAKNPLKSYNAELTAGLVVCTLGLILNVATCSIICCCRSVPMWCRKLTLSKSSSLSYSKPYDTWAVVAIPFLQKIAHHYLHTCAACLYSCIDHLYTNLNSIETV